MAGGNNKIDFQIGFSTDESGLKKLQANLTQIMNMDKNANPLKPLTQGEQDAIKKATILKDALQKAYNAELGTTNITKLNNELKKSGTTINECRNSFKNMGQQGANAYNLLGTQILSTNVKIKQTNKLLDKMAITFANTVRFGISSSIFNNMTGAIKKAVGYAEDLDESLTAIRIVSNKSADDMARFAKEANSAAKSLGSTTLDYTDASLIYYQQGLGDKEVKERTDVTLEMSNVLGESASEVSSYMTAIWNNFDNGSKSLEYYGDVITALGAATASSAAEISEGLEKFAAVADTVGLSYEYATTALATVVAETRQSADVVGTAFKTLFARIQDLELGETLDDGTTLGKYSQALEAVGINIKDQNGQLKEMDAILDEMGSKWNTLSKDTQVALAQTVAGTRQYTQLVALMDNWDEFGENLKTANTATGTLQKQQDIYLQSTEAKLKTLKATWQDLYGTLIDKDELNAGIEGLTNLVQVIQNFFESFGGGIKSISAFGVVLSNIFSKQLAQGIINLKQRFQETIGNAEILKQRLAQIESGTTISSDNSVGERYTANYEKQLQYASQIDELQRKGLINQEESIKLTEQQSVVGNLAEQIKKYDQVIEKQVQIAKLDKTAIDVENDAQKLLNNEVQIQESILNKYRDRLEILNQINNKNKVGNMSAQDSFFNLNTKKKTANNIVSRLEKKQNNGIALSDREIQNLEYAKKVLEEIKSIETNIGMSVAEASSSQSKANIAMRQGLKTTQEQVTASEKLVQLAEERANLKYQQTIKEEEIQNLIEAASANEGLSASVVGLTGSMSSLAMTWSSLNSVMETWSSYKEGTISFGDAFSQTLMTLSFSIPLAIKGMNDFISSISGISNAAQSTIASLKLMSLAQEGSNILSGISTSITTENTTALLTSLAAKKLNLAEMKKEDRERVILHLAQKLNIKDINEENIAEVTNTILRKANTASIWAAIKAKLADTAVMIKEAAAANILAGVLVTVVTVIVSSYLVASKKLQKSLQNQAKGFEETAEAHKKNAESFEEEAESLSELSKEYDNLLQQTKDGKISKDELKDSVIELCDKYDNENLKLEALIGNYEKLNRLIKDNEIELSEKAASEYQQTATDTINASVYNQLAENNSGLANIYDNISGYKPELQMVGSNGSTSWLGMAFNGIFNELGSIPAFSNGIFKLGTLSTQDEQGFLNQFQDIYNDDSYGDTIGLKIDKILENAATDDDFTNKIKEYADNNSEYAKEVYNIIVNNQETIQSLKESLDAYEENIKNAIILKASQQVESVESYIKQVQEVAREAFKNHSDWFEDEEDALKWAQKAMAAIDEVSEYANRAELTLLIRTKVIAGTDENNDFMNKIISDKLQNFSDSEINYIKYIISIEYQGEEVVDPEDILNRFTEGGDQKATMDLYVNTEIANKSGSILDNFYENGSFSNQDIEDMLKLDGFEDYLKNSMGMTIEYFRAYAKAQGEEVEDILYNYYLKSSEYARQATADIDKMEEKATAAAKEKDSKTYDIIAYNNTNTSYEAQNGLNADDAYKVAQESLANFQQYFNDHPLDVKYEAADGEIHKITATFEEIQKAYEDVSQKGLDNVDARTKAIYEQARNTSKVNHIMVDGWHKVSDEVSFLNNKIDSYTNLSKQAEQASNNFAKKLKEQANNLKQTNEAINKMQDAYKTFSSAQKEYNENGFLSVDTIQSLVALEPKYFEAIEVTNDGLTIKKDKIIEVMKAEMAQLAMEQAIAAETAVNALINAKNDQERADALVELQSASLNAANATFGLAESRLEDARAAGIAKAANQEEIDAINVYCDAAKKKIKLIESNAGKMNASNLDKMMNSLSSSKSSSEKKDKEHMKENIDAYHQWEQQIKACENALSELQERQSHLKGKQLLKNIQAQTTALKEQAAAQERLNAQYRAEAAALRGVLAAKGAAFDGSGNISNYSALLQQAQDKYNATVDAYNKKKTDANEKAVDSAKKEYDNLKDAIGDYEKALEGMQKAQQAMNELMQKQADIALAELETKWEIEFQMDTHKAQRQLSDFINNLNDDFRKSFTDWEKEFKNAKDNFFNGGIQEDIFNQIKKIEEIQDFMDDTKSRSIDEYTQHMIDTTTNPASFDPTKEGEYTFSEGDIFTSASDASEYLIQLGDQLKDLADELKSAYETAWEAYLEGINQAIEETDRLNNIIDKNIDKLEQYRKIQQLSLTGADSTKNSLEFNKTLAKQYGAQVQGFTAQKEKLEGLLATTGVTLRKDATGAIDESSVDVLNMDEDQKIIYEQILNYQDKILDTTVKRVENEKEILDLETKQTMNDLATQMFGSSDVDYLKQQWEDALKWEERYYNGYEQIYQIEQLGKKYDDLKHKELSLKAQEKINKAKAVELEELSKSENLSKDELAVAEKRLEVVQAEIALEEAQNNKNSMKLTRDETGNWSYQYVANEDDVAAKEQDLIDKTNEYYEKSKEAYQNGVEYAFEVWDTYSKKIMEIQQNNTISEEERQIRIQAVTDQMLKGFMTASTDVSKFQVDLATSAALLSKRVIEQNQIDIDNLSGIALAAAQVSNDARVSDLQTTRGEMKNEESGMLDDMKEYLKDGTEFFDTTVSNGVSMWQEKESEITNSILNASNTVQTKISEYQYKVRDYAKAIGLDLGNVSKSYDEVANSTDTAKEAVRNYINEQTSKLMGVKSEIDRIKAAWDIVATACKNAASSMQSYIGQTQAAVRESNSLAESARKAASEIEKMNSTKSSNKNNTDTGDKKYRAEWMGGTYSDTRFNIYEGNKKVAITGVPSSAFKNCKSSEDYSKAAKQWLLNNSRYAGNISFKTGGYTGEWSNGSVENNGRLAMLHQKELILNAKDTENMLDMVTMVREMQSASGAIDKAIINSIANMVGAITGVKVQSVGNTNSNNQNTSNTFNITAEFPNANDVNEIREAILSLPNLAQQYLSINTL